MNRRVVGAALLVAAALAIAPPASALFTSPSASSGATFTAATLQPPSNPAITWTCPKPNERLAQLTWTASPSSFVQGYLVERLAPAPVTSATVTSTSWGDPTVYNKNTTVQYAVTAIAYNWRSASATVTSTSPTGKTC